MGVLAHVIFQITAADLFFALDQKLDVDRQALFDRQPGLDAFHMGHELALVVAGAAGEDVAVALGGFEGRRGPKVQRIGWLHVVWP